VGVLILLAMLTMAVCDRQPSPCGGSFLPSPPQPPLPRFQVGRPAPVRRPSFNETEARLNSRLAAASYCPRKAIEAWACAVCEPSVRNATFFKSDALEAAGFVGIAHDSLGPQIVVVFRGTAANRNWLEDAFAGKRRTMRWGGGSVHYGFWLDFIKVQADVHALLSRKRFELTALGLLAPATPARVRLIGHSLGGALATLAAADLRLHSLLFRVDQLWTFGAPRVGDQLFVRWLMSSGGEVPSGAALVHWRVTHAHDPVVHLPLLSMGFLHAPTEVWYPDCTAPAKCAQDFYVCDDGPEGEDPLCSARVWLPACTTHSEDHLSYAGVQYDSAINCE
jgi:hypothetical protein